MDVPGVELRALPEIIRTYWRTVGAWMGCDWPVRFGNLGLNLDGLKSTQAALMAGATSGAEAAEWRRAANWLTQIEQDARQAEMCARAAVDLAARQSWPEALESADHACRIEARYHDHLVWQRLRDAIATESSDTP
jgi:hypothetical protein